MRTLVAVFFAGLCMALLLTPLVAGIGRKYGLVDAPSHRKVHLKPIPRIGGVALYLAFFCPFLGTIFYSNRLIGQIHAEPAIFVLAAGATLVFLMGLADDIFGLHPVIKFGVQILAALLAYRGGISISQLTLPWAPVWHLEWFALPVTVIWFLLVVNAFNLIDGLDGLAAGVCLFVSLVLLVLSIIGEKFVLAVGLAGLAGSSLGFLRYNFNPASIFMGDSGSYFLGYMLASLSILGSMKSQATVAILIPIVALGLPLMDTVLAPLRRFFTGRQLFRPDQSHIHHKLLKMGFSQRSAVLLLYGATVFLGLFALVLVQVQDRLAALILLALGITVFVGIRKLGYLEYLAVDKVMGYVQDVTDVMGLSKDRRTFLNHQIAIDEAHDVEDLWNRVTDALDHLRIDSAEMKFNGVSFPMESDHYYWSCREAGPFTENPYYRMMSVDLPLSDAQLSYGTLRLSKDLVHDPLSLYTFRRIEHLRRSIVRKLRTFEDRSRSNGCRPSRPISGE